MSDVVRRFPALRRLRRLLFYAVVRALAAGAARVPVRMAVTGMRLLGSLAWRVLPRERATARCQVRQAFPGLTVPSQESLARRSFAEFGENLVHSLRGEGPVVIAEADRVRLENVLAEARPVLVLTAHLGPWEVLGQYLAAIAAPLGVVTANPHNARLDRWLRERRSRRGMRAFDRRRQPLAAARWLRSGRTLAVLADLRGAGASASVPWFGLDAPTLVGPGRLARRCGARILPVGIRREGARHRVLVGQEVDWEDAAGDRDLTARCNAALEDLIRRAPAQWPWFHDRYGRGSRGWEDRQ